MSIASESNPLRRRSEERNVSRRSPDPLSSAPPNGAGFCYVPPYKHLTPSGVKNLVINETMFPFNV